jgi:chaperone LolA
MKKIIWFLIILFSAAAADEAEDILKDLQSHYEKVPFLKIEFEQVNHFKLSGIENSSTGVMYIAKDDRFRMESDERTIVTDGKTIWSYSPLNRQVVIDFADKSSNAILPREFLFSYAKKYYANILREYEEGEVEWTVVKLTPRPEYRSALRYIKIWLRKDKWLVKKIDYVDLNGNTTTFVVKSLKVLKNVNPEVFHYTPPENVRVVNLTGRND